MIVFICILWKNIIWILIWNLNLLFERFRDNYLKANNGKSHIILTTDHKLKINFMDSLICNEKIVKLLAVIFDNKLSFEPHLNLVSKKFRQKLHALTRGSKFISKKKLRVVMKAFIMSQFGYCPFVWMYHSRTLNSKINKICVEALSMMIGKTCLWW